jgi:outer membrane protein assembly factor BamB
MIEAVSGPPHQDRRAFDDAIDLGDARWDAEEAGAHWRPPAWVAAGAKVVALALVALGTVSAASTSAIPQLGEPLWSARVAWDSFSLGRDLVYLRDGLHTMVARDARTGVEVWRRDVSGNPMSVSEVGPELSTIFNSVRTASGESWSTVFLDPATGQVLGERAATTAAVLIQGVTPDEDRVLLYGFQEATSPECPEGQCGELALIDPPSLEPLWRFMTRRDERLVASFGVNGEYDTTDGFALLAQDGQARIFDAPTSAPALTVDVGAGATNGVLTHESLIVASRRGQHLVLTAYDRELGDRRWETEAPLGQVTEGTGYFYVDECGAMICGLTMAGTALLEPVTGRLVTVIADHAVMSVGGGLILSTRGGFPSGPADEIAIRSTADGRLLTELPRAFSIDWVDPGRSAFLLMQLGEARESRIILVEEDGRTRVLGTIPTQAMTCMARGDLLACHLTGGEVSIWQLPFAA